MSNPPLSVLIDTYNHERYIEQALVSVLEQDFPASEMEIVVVDDGSTDRTPDIVRKFAPRVRLLRKENGGQASAFNAGIPEVGGEVISFLDGDDWFAPGKLTAVMNALEQHPEAAAVGHGHFKVKITTGETFLHNPEENQLVNLESPKAAGQARLVLHFLQMGALTVRKATALRALPIPERLTFCADTPITTVAMIDGAYILNQPLFYYRQHSNNLFAARSDASQLQRRCRMSELSYRGTERLLARLGVPSKCIAALLYEGWTQTSRMRLRNWGGSPFDTLQTEMRFVRSEPDGPSLGYRIFKYTIVGTAALVLPPRYFYKARDWYAQRNLGRIRERFFKAGGKRPVKACR